jgi:hypothetical protein
LPEVIRQLRRRYDSAPSGIFKSLGPSSGPGGQYTAAGSLAIVSTISTMPKQEMEIGTLAHAPGKSATETSDRNISPAIPAPAIHARACIGTPYQFLRKKQGKRIHPARRLPTLTRR